MSIVETMLRIADRSGSEGIDVRRATATPTETRSSGQELATADAKQRARPVEDRHLRDRANKDRVIEDRAKFVLQSSSYHLIQQLSCEVNEGVLILQGHLPSYYLKQMAQALVLDLMCDGLVIDNQVEVDWT